MFTTLYYNLRLYFLALFFLLCSNCIAQNKGKNGALNDRATKSSQQYFDVNDPYFLAFFINAQSKGNKRKMFDSLIKKSPYYNSISANEMEFFIDSIRDVIFKDTGKACITGEVSVKTKNVFLPKSNFIFWINNKCFYKVGYHKRNTVEFAEEFLVLQKIKSISIVVPPKTTNDCIGKTIAHIYIFTKRKARINYDVANLEFKQFKIGNRWIGHN